MRIEAGRDYIFDEEARLPFTCKDVLGSGYSAVVQKVQNRSTKEMFARKTIKIPRERKGRDAEGSDVEEHFHNEVAIIRALESHRHIVHLSAP